MQSEYAAAPSTTKKALNSVSAVRVVKGVPDRGYQPEFSFSDPVSFVHQQNIEGTEQDHKTVDCTMWNSEIEKNI